MFLVCLSSTFSWLSRCHSPQTVILTQCTYRSDGKVFVLFCNKSLLKHKSLIAGVSCKLINLGALDMIHYTAVFQIVNNSK